ncbi:MAG TPA: helix-turn-helix domain-containing protein [Phormidium sp.]
MQKKYIKLKQEEIITLQEGHKNHPCYQVRNRCQCLLLSNQGKQVKELAAMFSVIPLTIYSWFYRWEEKGLVGLFNEKGRGRKPILLQAESEKIKTQVQAHAQQLKVARGLLKAELNKEFSHKTLKRYLKKLVEDGKGGEKA